MLEGILIPFVIVGLAELGDKTQLALLLLASRLRDHKALLLGSFLGFLLVDGFAVFAGGWLSTLLPEGALKIIAAIVFILFGILILSQKEDEEDETRKSTRSPFLSAFLLIFLTEWGDKTQIASALLGAKYSVLPVLIGVMAALTTLSILAIYAGSMLSTRLDKRLLKKVSGCLFILLGIVSLVR